MHIYLCSSYNCQNSFCIHLHAGIVLITDSIAATGLPDGPYKFGGQNVLVDSNMAKVAGTNVLAGR